MGLLFHKLGRGANAVRYDFGPVHITAQHALETHFLRRRMHVKPSRRAPITARGINQRQFIYRYAAGPWHWGARLRNHHGQQLQLDTNLSSKILTGSFEVQIRVEGRVTVDIQFTCSKMQIIVIVYKLRNHVHDTRAGVHVRYGTYTYMYEHMRMHACMHACMHALMTKHKDSKRYAVAIYTYTYI